MISEKDREVIKQQLGYGYRKKIEDYLIAHNIVKNSGEPYSYHNIAAVLDGKHQNHDIESAMLKMAYDEYCKKKAMEEDKDRLHELSKNVA